MTETWLDFAIRRPGPGYKQGYTFAPFRRLDEIEGEVKHSTEGPLLAAFGELDKPERRASWHFTIDTDGTVYQHFPLESITWHCGVAGDLSQDTSLIGNATLVGEEHVDRIGGEQLAVLTPPALAASIRISREVRRLCPRVAARPPTLRWNLWEHNWLSSTSCPSGLIPWDAIIQELEEDDMDPALEAKLKEFFLTPYKPARLETTFSSKADYMEACLEALDSGWTAGGVNLEALKAAIERLSTGSGAHTH